MEEIIDVQRANNTNDDTTGSNLEDASVEDASVKDANMGRILQECQHQRSLPRIKTSKKPSQMTTATTGLILDTRRTPTSEMISRTTTAPTMSIPETRMTTKSRKIVD